MIHRRESGGEHYHFPVSDGASDRGKFGAMFSSSGSGSSETILDGVSVLRADRQPCIICGHPTGDCVSHSPDATPPPSIRVQFAPLAEKTAEEQMVRVERDVYREVALSSMTKTRVLVAKAGAYMPKSKAEELGII